MNLFGLATRIFHHLKIFEFGPFFPTLIPSEKILIFPTLIPSLVNSIFFSLAAPFWRKHLQKMATSTKAGKPVKARRAQNWRHACLWCHRCLRRLSWLCFPYLLFYVTLLKNRVKVKCANMWALKIRLFCQAICLEQIVAIQKIKPVFPSRPLPIPPPWDTPLNEKVNERMLKKMILKSFDFWCANLWMLSKLLSISIPCISNDFLCVQSWPIITSTLCSSQT